MAEKRRPDTQEWKAAEDKVNQAEPLKRSAAKAGGFARRSGAVEELPPRLARRVAETKELASQKAESLLGPEGSLERELETFRRQNLFNAMRQDRDLLVRRIELVREETDLLDRLKAEPAGVEAEVLAEIRAERELIDTEREALVESSPEAFFGMHLRELKKYKEGLQTGKMVETPYVREQADDIAAHLRANRPVLIYGHLGSGKTELAMHIARKYIGKDALVVSGSKYTSLAELYGHQVLALDKVDKDETDAYAKDVEAKYEAWVAEHPNADEQKKSLAHDRILQTYLTRFKSGTVTDFFLGPIYRAMEEGRPVIIDEVNAIPHEVLISLNHILTRKPGDVVNVQQDSGKQVKIQEGFGIIMTGNLNQGQQTYVDRQDMDPAFLSRLYKKEYDYLPQDTDQPLVDVDKDVDSELFQLLLARVMDKNGNIEAPDGTMDKLWTLAKAARVTQNVFAGKENNSAYYFQDGGARSTKYLLKESVLSLRALDGIISQWQKDGYNKELDYYVWQEFISQSTVPADRAYLYQLFKNQFGFFQAEVADADKADGGKVDGDKGWPQDPDYGKGGNIPSFNIKAPKLPASKVTFTGPREVVAAAFGPGPERDVWPELDVEADESASEVSQEKINELAEVKERLQAEIEKLEASVREVCPV